VISLEPLPRRWRQIIITGHCRGSPRWADWLFPLLRLRPMIKGVPSVHGTPFIVVSRQDAKAQNYKKIMNRCAFAPWRENLDQVETSAKVFSCHSEGAEGDRRISWVSVNTRFVTKLRSVQKDRSILLLWPQLGLRAGEGPSTDLEIIFIDLVSQGLAVDAQDAGRFLAPALGAAQDQLDIALLQFLQSVLPIGKDL